MWWPTKCDVVLASKMKKWKREMISFLNTSWYELGMLSFGWHIAIDIHDIQGFRIFRDCREVVEMHLAHLLRIEISCFNGLLHV